LSVADDVAHAIRITDFTRARVVRVAHHFTQRGAEAFRTVGRVAGAGAGNGRYIFRDGIGQMGCAYSGSDKLLNR
jgi:hypothetical protein